MCDGQGHLYLLDGGVLRMLQLPAAWRRGPSMGGAQEPPQQQQQHRQLDNTGAGPAADLSAGEVRVASVACGRLEGKLRHGAYDPASRSLVLTSDTAVYRLPIEGLKGVAAAGAVREPAMVAGSGEASSALDGVGAEARFFAILGVAVDGAGAAWVLDMMPEEVRTRLARVDPMGAVVTVPAGLSGPALPDSARARLYHAPVVLRNGCLSLAPVSTIPKPLLLLQLGLTPPTPSSEPQHIRPAPGTLSSDLGDLLDRQPDGSADVEVEVGGQVFAAHRGVLAARSPYFRQRLDPGAGFADGRAPRLSLPDADPVAFGAVLRFMYTDSAGPVPPELLQPVGELADRLLLPGLCAQVGSQLLGRVCTESVVGLLLWAEQRSGSFGALLGGLKEWFLQHYTPGEASALPEEDVLLIRESPGLTLQLLHYRRADGRDLKRRRQE